VGRGEGAGPLFWVIFFVLKKTQKPNRVVGKKSTDQERRVSKVKRGSVKTLGASQRSSIKKPPRNKTGTQNRLSDRRVKLEERKNGATCGRRTQARTSSKKVSKSTRLSGLDPILFEKKAGNGEVVVLPRPASSTDRSHQ